ncbi:MAG: response regulator transcription factor [Mesorhizobium sp.]|nr:LuxR C-terminal-related transcriptional regulator [Mesorhizobium sp.]MBN9243219.1 response regulator transcription factor [Mesorhizobium sp.]
MLARNDIGQRLLVLVSLADVGAARRLSASLAKMDDLVAVYPDELDEGEHADVLVADRVGAAAVAPGTPLVLLSGEEGGDDKVSAEAVLAPDAAPALVVSAIRLAAAGYRIRSGEDDRQAVLADADDGRVLVEDPVPAAVHLSPREAQVLALLAEGAPNKVIARRLDISVHTAKFHVAAILVKLEAANRTDAIATAMRQGLVLV